MMATVEYLNYDVLENRGWDLHDRSTFEKAAQAALDDTDYGTVEVSTDESILEAAERAELGWSSKCLKGRCGRCVAVVVDGDVTMDTDQEFLTPTEVDTADYCLTCLATPASDLKLVYGLETHDALTHRVK